MIEFISLPPLLGKPDPQAQEFLDAKRAEAREWMRAHGIIDLASPIEEHPQGGYTGRVDSTTEGIR